MSRYTGPKARVSRRLGTNIWGTKGETTALDKRPYPPGEHGRGRIRESQYQVQLLEKQKLRFIYGVLEKQFRRYYKEAARQKGITGENLMQILESRLDNVVYRSGLAATRPQARQLVNHGHFRVNGMKVDIPSYQVSQGDVITLRERSKDVFPVLHATDTIDRVTPEWLDVNIDERKVSVETLPSRQQIDTDVQEQLIVELYSK